MHRKPDRSDVTPNFTKSPDNPATDIGWNEGFLSDGRPYRVEQWAEDQVTSVTFFMSTSGSENFSNAQFADLLEREQLLRYLTDGRRSAFAMPYTDASRNSVWSVNVVCGDDEDTFVEILIPIRPYTDAAVPVSLHTAPSTDAAWTTVASALGGCLAAQYEDEFLIISYKRANYYVQFAGLGRFGMRMEASSNSFIEPEASLVDEQYQAMTALGWQRATALPAAPGESTGEEGSPNFFIDIGDPVNAAAISQLAVTTLRRVYGIAHPGMLQYFAFGNGEGSIRFPTLGLKHDRPAV